MTSIVPGIEHSFPVMTYDIAPALMRTEIDYLAPVRFPDRATVRLLEEYRT